MHQGLQFHLKQSGTSDLAGWLFGAHLPIHAKHADRGVVVASLKTLANDENICAIVRCAPGAFESQAVTASATPPK